MNIEVNALAGSDTPVVPVEVTTPAVVETQPQTEPPPVETVAQAPSDAAESPQEPRKSRAQERIEELARENRRLREESQFREDMLRNLAPQSPAVPRSEALKPTLESVGFDHDRFADALTDWAVAKAETAAAAQVERMQTAAVERARMESARNAFADSEGRFADTVEDYTATVYSNRTSITPHMADAIMASPIGPQVAYQIAKSGKDREIASLPPALQGRAIALIEAQLSVRPVPQVTRSAPPVQPVNTAASQPPAGLRDDQSDADWIAQRRAQLAATRR